MCISKTKKPPPIYHLSFWFLAETITNFLLTKMFQKLETETFWGSHTVHTVSRGFLCSRVEEKWNEIRKLADDTDIEELTKFVCNLKDSDNFGGVLHRNM